MCETHNELGIKSEEKHLPEEKLVRFIQKLRFFQEKKQNFLIFICFLFMCETDTEWEKLFGGKIFSRRKFCFFVWWYKKTNKKINSDVFSLIFLSCVKQELSGENNCRGKTSSTKNNSDFFPAFQIIFFLGRKKSDKKCKFSCLIDFLLKSYRR